MTFLIGETLHSYGTHCPRTFTIPVEYWNWRHKSYPTLRFAPDLYRFWYTPTTICDC